MLSRWHSSFLTEEKHAQHADVGAGTEFITLAIRSKAIRYTRCNELLLLLFFFPFVFTEVSFHYGGLMQNSTDQTHCSYYWKACRQIHLPIFAVVTLPAKTLLLGKSNPLRRAPHCSAGHFPSNHVRPWDVRTTAEHPRPSLDGHCTSMYGRTFSDVQWASRNGCTSLNDIPQRP